MAIVGSGMAGLSTAWLLSRQGCHVTIFEKGSAPGLSAHSRDFSAFIDSADGPMPGDVPSRMFNASLWPAVTQLYRDAGVEFEPVDSHQTFSHNSEVLLKVKLPYSSVAMTSVFNANARRLLGSLKQFRAAATDCLQGPSSDATTFGDFVSSLPSSEDNTAFLEGFLFPVLTSTVFTCPTKDLLNYPCFVVLSALRSITDGNHPLMRTVAGSAHAANALLDGVGEVRFNSVVDKVHSDPASAFVRVGGEDLKFEHVILATQANHASRLVAEDFPDEASLLDQFRYTEVPVTVHTDSSVLPERRNDWGTFNFQRHSHQTATCTVWMNRFHRQWTTDIDVFHSIFPGEIAAEKVLYSSVLQRPLVDSKSEQLHAALDDLHSRRRNVWFVGSYASPGVPLLESAVRSSHALVEKLNAIRSAETV
ncbi:FAD-dependent oxidoreductase [Mariniblastus fucicola]|uniref:FAD-dependent oxidoreductase n=1 Tax=Mariniblastus fucicola TaxID=980251 RepID=UPI0036F1C6D0